MFKSLRKQKGYLTIVAVILIIVIGFLGTSIAYLFSINSSAAINFQLADKAFYYAESGLEKAKHLLFTPILSGTSPRLSCATIPGNSNLTNSTISSGVFTVNIASGSPNYASTTLSSSINNSVRTISLASTSGIATSGRIFIDKEAVDYASISGNNLLNVTRGANSTIATSHSSGTSVSQYQCTLDSLGGIPNLTSPLAKRELQEAFQLQEGWAVGVTNSNMFIMTHWNRPTEIAWTNTSISDSTNRESLNGVSLASYGEGWAVGNVRNNNFTVLHRNGTNWTINSFSGACNGQHLNSVSTLSSQEAWAVGARYRAACAGSGPFRYSILKWNGASWSLLTPSSSPSIPADLSTNQNLNAVHVISASGLTTGDLGFAVGVNAQILQFNGSQWIQVTSPITSDLNSVFVVSASEAWAVGNSGRILKWNGTSWSSVTSPTSTTLNSVFMLDTNSDGLADYGWAVGNSGVAVYYNGSSWSSQNPGGGTLRGVTIVNVNDVWAVGNSGRVTHWDGTNWTDQTSNVSPQLSAIAIIAPSNNPSSAWREVFN